MHLLNRLLRWLYPGIGVKRWAGLAALGALAAVVGLLAWIGKDLVRTVYRVLSPERPYSLLVALALIVLGLGGLFLGINRAVRAIVRGISPQTEGRTSEVLYSRRRLRRGPRVVALGGGTGLSTLLRGLKGWTANIAAVVTVMDDGGSSGRLRKEMKMLPPGDIRNCLIALAEDESRIAQLFQHRFQDGSGGLGGHSLGNLVLAGLKERTGRFETAVEELSRILNIRGHVLPATLEDVQLVAEMADGAQVTGEVAIAEDPRRIAAIRLSRPRVRPYEAVLEALEGAEVIVLGPGSLFTSIIPNLLVEGVARAVERSPAVKVYVANLMTQPGETDGFMLSDHLRELGRYLDLGVLDFVIANSRPVPPELAARYAAEGAAPVEVDADALPPEVRARLIQEDLLEVVELEAKPTLKHHPQRLAQAILRCAKSKAKARLKWALIPIPSPSSSSSHDS